MSHFQTVCTVGIPMDLGQSRRGVDMGPSAIRYAGLGHSLQRLGFGDEHLGNIDIPDRETLPPEGGMAFLPATIDACERIYETAREATTRGSFPLFLGGDHSIALGTVGGVSVDEPVGVLWIDAHTDMNTPETSPSGNLHGMPLAALLGLGSRQMIDIGRPGAKLGSADVVVIGARSVDPGERNLIQSCGLRVFSMREIDQRGLAPVAQEALEALSHCARLHVSLDMDALDPKEAPGVGTPVPGGLTYREAHLLMELVAESGRLWSAEVVEINPILDEQNRSARIACGLLESLLGKAIL
jgi:arginase